MHNMESNHSQSTLSKTWEFDIVIEVALTTFPKGPAWPQTSWVME